VTTAALTGDIAVVEGCTLPTGGVMTILTLRPGRNMVGRLANRTHSVMTDATGGGDLRMIHRGDGQPTAGSVTTLAQVCGG